LTSVESAPGWYKRVGDQLAAAGLRNVDYRLYDYNRQIDETSECTRSEYVTVSAEAADNTIDFVLVDGVYRSACALAAIPKLKTGGLLVVDNANWYLPSTSKAPDSRSMEDGPINAFWAEFAVRTMNWRSLTTSNGITDTRLWIKS
jgi:predicted O-methyltransferase YrrM